MKRFFFLSCLIMGLITVNKIQSATIFDDTRKGATFVFLLSVVSSSIGCFVQTVIEERKFKLKRLLGGAYSGAFLSIIPMVTYFLVRNRNIQSNTKRILIAGMLPVVTSLLCVMSSNQGEKAKKALQFGVPVACVSGGLMYAGTRSGLL